MVGVILLGKLQGLNPGVLMTGQTREGEQREVGGASRRRGDQLGVGLVQKLGELLEMSQMMREDLRDDSGDENMTLIGKRKLG
jgi:hypothetical protein